MPLIFYKAYAAVYTIFQTKCYRQINVMVGSLIHSKAPLIE